MKLVTSAAVVMMVAGAAFAAKNAEITALSPAPGASGGNVGPRVGGQILAVDVSNTPSWNPQGNPLNAVSFINIGAGFEINGIGWDVNIQAFAPSWRSEAAVLITDSTGTGGFFLRPGTDTSSGGPTRYTSDTNADGIADILKLADVPLPNVRALADGLIRLEFFETYDDGLAFQDGAWQPSSTLFFQVIPTPATAGLLGLVGVGALGRKRR